ncbi:hypothetical protein ACI2OX_17435 [Bacillus sp. N9]
MIQMPRVINRIFWGLMLVLLDIHIVFIDLLPDFIGYLLIASALGTLQPFSTKFSKAKGIAYALAFLSLPYLLVPQMNILKELQPSFGTMLANTLYHLMHTVFVFIYCMGLLSWQKTVNFHGWRRRYIKRNVLYNRFAHKYCGCELYF